MSFDKLMKAYENVKNTGGGSGKDTQGSKQSNLMNESSAISRDVAGALTAFNELIDSFSQHFSKMSPQAWYAMNLRQKLGNHMMTKIDEMFDRIDENMRG